MSNEIQVFNNAAFGEIRIIMEDGNPLFCGKDVAVALGYSNFRDALSRHCKGVVKRDSLTKGGVQSISYIPEGDLYRLIAHSQLPDAERFESWVFDDVLPSIRKTGSYLSPVIDSAMLFKMAEAMAEKERRITALEAANQSMLPKAEFYDAVTNSPDTIDMAETAKVLNMGVGRNTIFKILRQQRVLNRNNIPYQEYIDRGYFRCIESKYTKADGTNCVNIKTVVFQKGVDFIRTTVNNALTEQKEGKSA
jgi:prophage antirepressor-like protein